MNLKLRYLGRSGLVSEGSSRILRMAPNLDRDSVSFDAPLRHPLRFREAISVLHDVVINNLKFEPRDKTDYQNWKADQLRQEQAIRRDAIKRAQESIDKNRGQKPPPELKKNYAAALKTYWKSRRRLNQYLRKNNARLWRKLMPYDPVITVADDVLMFECFSSDESSYGCLSVDRDSFGHSSNIALGTTNVDYSWDLYDSFQSLRTYRETRFNINPEGFVVKTESVEEYHEEKIDLPNGWLRGFMQLQSAMGLPMRKVSLSVGAVYSMLTFLRRNKSQKSPRAIRFELRDGQAPKLVLEPWGQEIESMGTQYDGPNDEPIRIWGRRRLLTLARLLPLAERFDVYLLGTGLPSFWVARMGDMRFTLGLSGWTTNDWTRGSAIQMLLPREDPSDALVADAANRLLNRRSMDMQQLVAGTHVGSSEMASAMNQLALRGQAIYDLDAGKFRWRQMLPMALSDKEFGAPHPERAGAIKILFDDRVKIATENAGPRGGWIVTGKSENQQCEALIADDGMILRGKCLCSWHFKFGIRNGPCRHIQSLRDKVLSGKQINVGDWYEKRLAWAGRT